MIKNVVVPLDGLAEHEVALPVALSLAARTDCRVELLAVVSAGLENVNRLELEEITRRWGDDVRVRVLTDEDVGRHLIDEAALEGTLVCLSSAGRGAIGEMLVGSVGAQILRDSLQPVLVVGPHCPPRLTGERLAIALDGTAHAEAVIPPAVDLAGELGLQPWLYEVLPPNEEPLRDTREDRYLAQIAQQAAPTVVRHGVIRDRHPNDGLVELSNQPEVAMLAIATHGERPFQRLLTGSVALRVVHRATTPVLVYHPIHR